MKSELPRNLVRIASFPDLAKTNTRYDSAIGIIDNESDFFRPNISGSTIPPAEPIIAPSVKPDPNNPC